MQSLKGVMLKVPVLLPDNRVKLIWDGFLLFLLLLDTLIIPLNLCFKLEEGINQYVFQMYEMFLLYLILIDMIVTVFTAYYSKGVIIMKKSKILKKYLSDSFFWDFIIVVPYFLVPIFGANYAKFILMFRLVKMKKIFVSLEEYLFLSNKNKGIYDLFKLMILIIYVGHFFACLWVYVAQVEMSYGIKNTWIQNFNLIDYGWESQYVSSLYFAVYTMVTVGYGDVYPSNMIERSLCIVLMILACGVFAYSLNRFGTILEEMYREEIAFK